jgi:hypothetical protein
MDGLVEFLAARYDEAEALARGVDDHSEPWPGQWKADGNLAVRTYNGHVLAYAQHGEFKPGFAAYVADNDPAHRLADIALKRAILAEHAPYDCSEPAVQRCTRCASDDAYPNGVAVMAAYPCATARQLGNEFSKHPEYKAGWAS